jgi:hypothetical protein
MDKASLTGLAFYAFLTSLIFFLRLRARIQYRRLDITMRAYGAAYSAALE